MTFKKIFMLICLVICLFAMASVCASDADNTTMECTDENLEINEDSQLTQTNIGADTDSADDSATDVLGKNLTVEGNTFEDIGNKIIEADAGDTIYLNATTYKGSGNWIEIGKSITIEGNGAVLDAQGQSRMFYVTTSDVTIKNITFINGHDEGDGGAICWSGDNGKVSDCNFMYCAADNSGGAICWNNNGGVVSDCSFVNNSAGSEGGAIIWSRHGDNGVVSDCSFVNNFAIIYGGAICWVGDNGVVSDCSFVNNSAHNVGGAIDWGSVLSMAQEDGHNSNGTVSNCSFVNNYAGSEGGAIEWYASGDGSVVNCSFVNNTAGDCGGAIRWMSNNIVHNSGSVSGCIFVNNSAHTFGGAIEWHCARDGSVVNCSFVNNTVDNLGGAIDWFTSDNGTVSCCTFIGNVAYGDNDGGGAIYWRSDEGKVSDCIFVNNSAYSSGGAINWNGKRGSVSDCSFINNYFINPFGHTKAVTWMGEDGSLSNSNFKYCDVTTTDEDLCLTLTLQATLNYNSDIDDAKYGLDKYNLSFWNGTAYETCDDIPTYGDVKFVGQTVTLEIYDSKGKLVDKLSGKTNSDGQIVYDYFRLANGGYTYNVRIDDKFDIFAGSLNIGGFNQLQSIINRAPANSIINLTRNYTYLIGIDNITEGIVIDKQITINGNGATIDAKGLSRIFNVTEGVTLTLANVTLINGHAEDGGAIYSNGTLVILNSTLQANHASSQGGAIYSNGNLTIVNSVIDDNAASFGVVNLVGTGSIVNSTLSNNNGEWGGAVYSFFANLTITGSNITDNYARVAGAGVYNYGGNVTINSSTLKDNDAPVGSAVWTITEEGVVLDDVRLVDNAGESLNVYDGGTIDTSSVKFMTAVAFKIEDINDTPMGCEITINITELNKGKEFTGNVSVFIGDENYTVEIINGTGLKKIIPDLNPGIYTVRLTFNETEIYEAASAQSNPFHIRQKQNINAISIVLSESAFTYNAEVQKPTVTVSNGLILKEGVDYTLQWSTDSPKNAGTYAITVTGIGAYNGTAKVTFMIGKAANPLKVKTKTVKVKFSKLNKKAQKLKVTKVVKFTKKGQGTLTYKKVSGNKKIAINKKNGMVTIKKGLKKGTYKVKVKIKANGNANYKASAFKTVTFKIKIK